MTALQVVFVINSVEIGIAAIVSLTLKENELSDDLR
jgi:hypothetical protein